MTSRVSQEIIEVAYLVTAKVTNSQEVAEAAHTTSAKVTNSQEVVEVGYQSNLAIVASVQADIVHRMVGDEIRIGSIIIEYAYVDEFGRRQGPAAQ